MKNVVVGVTGGIAAYKMCTVVSALAKLNINVDVIMTKNAEKFICPLTFQTLSGNPAVTDMFAPIMHWEIAHISLAKKADIILVAPATADIIAKAACGIADDMLSTTLLASKAKLLIAPSMNTNMYEHSATQHNLAVLKNRGTIIIEPECGRLACKDIGRGRMAEPDKITEAVLFHLNKTEILCGKNIIVTAGACIEDIDPIRCITNRSSGKMGYAAAAAAACAGANVTLITFETNLPIPYGIKKTIRVRNAEQMHNAVLSEYETSDAVIKTAAVADFTPKEFFKEKIKKSDTELQLDLVRTKDILAELGQKKAHRILVGFAAETGNTEKGALEKLKNKHLDIIVANQISQENSVFGSDFNEAVIYKKDGTKISPGKIEKNALAALLMEEIAGLM